MRELDDLIYDRTQADLINDTDKAYIDYNDLNRVENACQYLANIFGISITTKTWEIDDYRMQSDMDRLKSNIDKLKSKYEGTKNRPLPSITYTSISEANNIERLLFDIETVYLSIEASKPMLAFTLGAPEIGNRSI